MREEIFRADNVTYARGGVNLLDNFNLHVFKGEILGLFFADNQGKDEFVRLAHENHAIDYGRVFFKDKLRNSYISGRAGADAPSGVGYISRAGGLIDSMTVAENVFVMRKGFRKYIINKSVLVSQFNTFASEYGIEVDGGTYVRDISDVDAYIIRLLKDVLVGHSLIIVRNAGIEYGNPELTRFQQQIRRFAERGVSFIYISGDIHVLTGACDRIAIAEGGRVVRNVERSEYRMQKLVRYHYAHDSLHAYSATDTVSALRFDGVGAGDVDALDFSISKGESVLLWDRMDFVREDVKRILSKEIRPRQGEVRVNGVPLSKAKDTRISFIAEAPTRSMIFGEMSYLDNLCIRAAKRVPELWLKAGQRDVIREEYREIVGDCIDADSPRGLPAALLYDLVYLREYIYNPQILVVERPFAETDIKLRLHVMSRIAMFRSRGTTILILDNNTTNNDKISDRILIVSRNGIAEERTPPAEGADG